MLARLARPKTRAQALADGDLVDCTRAAAWCGFQVPVAMSFAAWEETVGRMSSVATTQERADAGQRLRTVCRAAALAVQQYQKAGVVLPSIRFTVPAAAGTGSVRCRLRAGAEGGQPFITMTLDGET